MSDQVMTGPTSNVTQPQDVAPVVDEVAEVDFEAAKHDEAPKPQAAAEEKTPEDVLDIIVPKSDPKVWTIGPADMQRQYVQKELSFVTKMQWFALVGEVLDKALSGPQGMSLNSLFNAPGGRQGALRVEDFRDADTFVQAIAKLLSVAPDFLVKSYCLWLNVPDYERDLAANLMSLPQDEGGLSDEDGMEMIAIFIDQNYEAIYRFFTEHLAGLQKRVQAQNQKRSQQSA